MKKSTLITAAGFLAIGGNGVGQTESAPSAPVESSELLAYQSAAESGSPEDIQRFLATYPDSAFFGAAFGALVRATPYQLEQLERPAVQYAQYGSDSDPPDGRDRPPTAQPSATTERARVAQAERSLSRIRSASANLNRDIDRCDPEQPIRQLNRCLGDALQVYAGALASREIVLPKELRSIPRTVARAAREVRRAPTKERAQAAVERAITQVRKSSALLEATDETPVTEVQSRMGTIVAQSLAQVDAKLEEAVGL